ncbi:MAG: tetratricopeptide repeat protein [Sedimentisphaerales bacterium]
MNQTPNKLYILLIYLGLALATFIVFEPVRKNEFINYDDDEYITENPQVISGLTRKSIVWAFTTSHANNWHPLTWLSHILDCHFFRLDPSWHHLTSLFFHIVNTLLLFYIFKRMTAAIWPGAFIALAFALHPLHVESVAWVAERKDLLCSLFWMLTIIAYIRYAERPTITKYLLVILFLFLGLMAKPMLVTLPFVLLLLDYWPLRRLKWKRQVIDQTSLEAESFNNQRGKYAWKLLAEKLPLLILVAASCVITLIVQQSAGAMKTLEKYPVNMRVSNAVVSYLGYLIKMFYPTRLALLYPLRPYNIPKWQPWAFLLILIIISAAVIYSVRHRRYLLVGWLWYLGTLVPVIGVVQVGSQAMADRYTYLPSIGIFIIVAYSAAELKNKLLFRKIVLPVSAALVIAALMICTRLQLRHWKNNLTLYEHTLAITEKNFIILYNYGHALSKSKRPDEAVVQFKRALRIKPDEPDVYNNLGAALKEMGKINQAIDNWKKALALDPSHPDAHFNLGLVLGRQESHDQAIYHFQKALQAKPNWPEAYYELGGVYFRQGRLDLAALQCIDALRLKPDYLIAQVTLAHILVEMGQIPTALQIAKKASKLAAATSQEDPTPKILNHIQRYKETHEKTSAPTE